MNRLLTALQLISRLALRNLFRNRRRTLLTVLLISLSLAMLMFTNALMRGMLNLMVSSAAEVFAGEAQTHRRGFLDAFDAELYMADTRPLEAKLRDSPEVAGFSVRTITPGMIASQTDTAGGLIYGVNPEQEAGVSRLQAAVTKGSYLTGKPAEMLVGQLLAEQLEVTLGDRMVLTFAAAKDGSLSQSLFRISGLFRFGLRDLDENLVFINLEAAREALGIPEGGHEVAINLVRPAKDSSPLPLFAALSDDRVLTRGWIDLNPEIKAIIGWVDFNTVITGGILFLLATFGIVNSLFMSIYERIYEFGVARALGTDPLQIFGLILFEALLLGILGAAFGLLAGGGAIFYFSQAGLYFGEMEFEGILATHIYPSLAGEQFTTFPAYVICLTLLVSIYPAFYAARLVPAHALQRSL